MLIQNDILHGGVFRHYAHLFFNKGEFGHPNLNDPKKLSDVNIPNYGNVPFKGEYEGKVFDDFALMRVVEETLVRVLTFEGLVALKWGLTTFKMKDGKIVLEPVRLAKEQAKKFLSKQGHLKAVSSNLGYGKYPKGINKFQDVLTSALISGYSHVVDGLENVNGNWIKHQSEIPITPPAGSIFLSRYYALYNPSYWQDYSIAKNQFLDNEHSAFIEVEEKIKRDTRGRELVRGFLIPFIDDFVDAYFDFTPFRIGDPLYEQFELSDPANLARYKELTKLNWRSFIASRVDISKRRDICYNMRQAYFEGKDFILEFKSTGGRMQEYSDNPFIKRGMTILIPWNRMHSFFRSNFEAFSTLVHSETSKRELKLSLEIAITNNKKEKLGESIDSLWDIFKLLKAQDPDRTNPDGTNKWFWLTEAKASPQDGYEAYFRTPTILVRIYRITGAGLSIKSGGTLQQRDDRFASYSLKFTPSVGQSDSVQKMIVCLSMLSFYLFLDQDHAAYINMGGRNNPHSFLTISARQSLPLEIIDTKSEGNRPLVSIFDNPKFSQFVDQLTPEALASFGQEWSKIFGPGDLGNFLEYHDVERDEIVRFIWDLVKEKLLEEVNAILKAEGLEELNSLAQFMQVIQDCGFDLTGGKLG